MAERFRSIVGSGRGSFTLYETLGRVPQSEIGGSGSDYIIESRIVHVPAEVRSVCVDTLFVFIFHGELFHETPISKGYF